MAKNKLGLIKKFFSSLKDTGISATYKKVVLYFGNKNVQNQLKKYSFDGFYQAKYLPSNTTKTDILPICFYNINHMDISRIHNNKPLFNNHYMPRIPLLFTENYVERINYHIRLAKEYQIYAFCYEITDINLFTQFISYIKLSNISMPFCFSLNHKLSIDNINSIFNSINYDDYIKVDNKYIIILECSQGGEEINQFINHVVSALGFMEGKYQLWCKVKSGVFISHTAITCVINTYNINTIKPVSDNPVKSISLSYQHNLYYYSNIIKSCKSNKEIPLLQYNVVTNSQDMLKENKPTFYKYNLAQFYNWVKKECNTVRANYSEDKRFLFIDSFNNWEKYNHIVPEQHTGYAFLNTMYRAMFNKKIYGKKLSSYSEPVKQINNKPQICIHAHIFYIDLLDDIINQLKLIPYDYDIHISTNSYKKADLIMNILEKYNINSNIFIDVFENKGRDIAPFIEQMRYSITRYKFVCHIHSKKSFTDVYGNNWRDYLFKSLFGSSENIDNIIKNLEYNKGLGIVFPKAFQRLEDAAHWGLNKHIAEHLIHSMGMNIMLPINNLVFPVGNMFWARVDAIIPFFTHIKFNDFPNEKGQIDGTLAHAIERLWVYVAEYCGYTYSYCNSNNEQP
mgnify:CR=1 FL=1